MAYVLYHRNCYDGFGAAWAANQGLTGSKVFIPVLYGEPLPDIPDWQDVYIVDFSYPADVLKELVARSKSVTVLDHHKTAEEALTPLIGTIENLHITFDMNRSGAILTWNHFFPTEEAPLLLQYVEDRDLWNFKLPESNAINGYIMSYPMDFDEWNSLEDMILDENDTAVIAGRAIFRTEKNKVEQACNESYLENIGGYAVPVVNVQYSMGSMCGSELLRRNPTAPFAAYWFKRADGKTQYGLRSRKGEFDCSRIAKMFGGGGHASACGFTIPCDNPRS